MCGIAGILRLDGRPTAEDVAAVLAMLDAQTHRGPDDWGLLLPSSLAGTRSLPPAAQDRDHVSTYADHEAGPGAVMGARRLAIIDRSPRGRMPMGDVAGRRWVTHNGEIYNYRELRDELRGDGPFRSDSDTEAIVRGHARWGDLVLERLRGMFAFALYETWPRPRVVLARDRLGIKPLYYHRSGERLVWASEVRALVAGGLVPDAPSLEARVRFLELGSVPAPLTTVAGVMALEAGSMLTAEAERISRRRYWDLGPFAPTRRARVTAGDRRDAVAATRAALRESVRLHLVSDVPLGVFLSGGVDSSALVSLAAPLVERPLTTLSIAFDEAGYSEAEPARAVARRFATDHREITVGPQDVWDALPAFFRAMDEPTADGVNTYLVAEAARRLGVTVVLSGTGGDEVFWGYRHLRRAALLESAGRAVSALPGLARAGLARATRAARRTPPGALDRLDHLDVSSPAGVYVMVRGLFGRAQVQELLGIGPAELAAHGPPLPGAPRAHLGGQGLALAEFAHYLQNQLLKDADVMGMAHSVEVRVPFLDHRLVEGVVGLPPRIKLEGAAPKSLLLAALDGPLPREVWDRPKMGFTPPFSTWLRAWARDLRAESLAGGGLVPAAVGRVWDGFEAGRLHWSRAWALLVLARQARTRGSAAA